MDKKCETSSSSDEPCEEIDVYLPRSKKGKRKYTRESCWQTRCWKTKKQSKKKRILTTRFVEKRLSILIGNVKKKNFQIIKLVTLIAMKWCLSQPLKLTNNSQIFLLYLVCNSNRCVSSKHSGVLIFTL